MSSLEEKIEKLVEPKIVNLGYELYDVQYVKEGKDYFLRIFIDNPNGISLEDCEKVNNAITDLLDDANYIKQQYFLEVSSPNVSYKIKNLIQKGYLNKVMDEKDRRIFHLEVTDKFKKFYNKNDYSGMFVIDKIEKMFDSSELKRLEELLDLIVNKTKIEKE